MAFGSGSTPQLTGERGTAAMVTRPMTLPLVGSLLVTAAVVAFVCEPPAHQLRSWGQVATLATMYLLAAGAVHALAVWGVCRVQEEETTGWASLWVSIRVAWVAIVWLPLIALLTKESSPWVAAFLPVTAVFGALLLRRFSATSFPLEEDLFDAAVVIPPGLFEVREAPALWRVLLPAALTALAAEMALVLLANDHAWMAGCLLAAAVVWLVERWMARSQAVAVGERGWRVTSVGNSVLVWVLLAMALVPFVASYMAAELGWMPNVKLHAPPKIAGGTRAGSRGYTGIVLYAPKKPHAVVAPVPVAATSAPGAPKVIPFDGAYWYFQRPETEPGKRARVERGDPMKNRVFSTDQEPLVMEAHQKLGQPVALSCCRSVQVDVKNGDSRPGRIWLAVELDSSAAKDKLRVRPVFLGMLLLASSAVSPMPLKRAPVEDKLMFPIPKEAHGRTFDEITVRVIPEANRALAGAQVGVEDFVLQP